VQGQATESPIFWDKFLLRVWLLPARVMAYAGAVDANLERARLLFCHRALYAAAGDGADYCVLSTARWLPTDAARTLRGHDGAEGDAFAVGPPARGLFEDVVVVGPCEHQLRLMAPPIPSRGVDSRPT
jgi:hypothetical protein